MIGTNNIGSNPPEQIADGVKMIVEETRQSSARKVLLLGRISARQERGQSQVKTCVRRAQGQPDHHKLDDGKGVFYLDLWTIFSKRTDRSRRR